MITKDLDIVLETYVDPKSWTFYIDSELIDNVIINLIKNAVEALEGISQPRINIFLKHSNLGKTSIEIKDNGKGMTEEVMNEIFVPFYTTKREGSGIGLSLSNRIVRSHGGTIHVTSLPGKGTAFTIVL